MNIHEYQAKKLMREYGISVPKGDVASSVDEALSSVKKIGGNSWAIKAQVHAGGRGKAGGIKIAKDSAEVKQHTSDILGMTLKTKQTRSSGIIVNKVLIERTIDIEHEYYLSITLDRTSGKLIMIASSEGGVDIEQVSKESPDKIITAQIDPSVGFTPFISRKLAYNMGLSGDMIKKATNFFSRLYKLYIENDCTLAEINPMVTTKAGDIIALDAKLNFDDNSLFRNDAILKLQDPSQITAQEKEAKKHGLSFISLEGNIGCLVNGAGLAMATMDIIKTHGGMPANFLDVGGGASQEAVEKAFALILKDDKVTAILVNIFGGIMRCDTIANGIITAANKLKFKVPLIVRLEGTNISLGKKILQESGLAIISATDLEDAAIKSVKAAKGEK